VIPARACTCFPGSQRLMPPGGGRSGYSGAASRDHGQARAVLRGQRAPWRRPPDKLLGALAGPNALRLQFRSSVLRFGSTPKGGVNSCVRSAPQPGRDAARLGRKGLCGPGLLAGRRCETKPAHRERFSDDISKQGSREDQQSRLGTLSFRRHFVAAPRVRSRDRGMDANRRQIAAQRSKFEIPAALAPALGDSFWCAKSKRRAAPGMRRTLQCAEGKVIPTSRPADRASNPAISYSRCAPITVPR